MSEAKAIARRIAGLICEIRRSCDLNQRKLALALDVSQAHLSRVEHVRAVLTAEEWFRLCNQFNVSTDAPLDEARYQAAIIKIRNLKKAA